MARKTAGLMVERLGSEAVVFVPSTNEAHSLNEMATIIFDLCDGTSSEADMVTAVQASGLPASESVVRLALDDLADAGLISSDEAPREPRMTRRLVIRRLGLSATAIAMLPVVDTIFVQDAAAQTSGMPTSTTVEFTTAA